MPIDFDDALYDKLQTKLGDKPLPNTFKFAKLTLKDLVKDKTILCPFCLEVLHISDFLYSQGLYKCKVCNNRITEHTLKLMFEWFNCEKPNVREFAKWVFGYRLNGFFQKIKFKEWNKNLYDLGFSFDFWNYYKVFKGEYQEEKEMENEE